MATGTKSRRRTTKSSVGGTRSRKRTTTKSSVGATKRKRTTAKSGVGASTVKIGGINFSRFSCHTTKTAAKEKAESIRKSGFTARVVGKCVYKGRKRK